MSGEAFLAGQTRKIVNQLSSVQGGESVDEGLIGKTVENEAADSEIVNSDTSDSSFNNTGNPYSLPPPLCAAQNPTSFLRNNYPIFDESDSSELSDPPELDDLDELQAAFDSEFGYTRNIIMPDQTQDLADTISNGNIPQNSKYIWEDSDSPPSSIASLSPPSLQGDFIEKPALPKEELQSPFQNPTDSPPKPTTPKKQKLMAKSPYFPPKPPTPRKPRPQTSCIPFPPLSSTTFGLLQEKFAHNPFWLLIGVTFLKKTRGKQAIPIFYQLFEKYKTVEALAEGNVEEIEDMIRVLGLGRVKAKLYVEMARKWIGEGVVKGKRWRTRGYPGVGDGRDVGMEECVGDEADDPRVGAVSHFL